MVVRGASTAARGSRTSAGGERRSPSFAAGSPGRRQVPVFSPISAAAIAASAVSALDAAAKPRERLRRRLCRRFAADDAVLCGSGTQALRLALRLIRRRGHASDRFTVALPAFTCFDVAAAAVAAGADLRLYDVDPATLGPDFASLERTLAAGAAALVITPLYGVPVEWGAVDELARRHDVAVIEDAAQGHGAAWEGRPLGSLGEIGVLSFGRGKGWTGASGGAVLLRGRAARDTEARATPPAARFGDGLRPILAAVTQWALARPSLYAIPASIPWLALGETRYRPAGSVRRMTRFAAALLLRTDRAAIAEARRRRTAAARLAAEVRFGGAVRRVRVPVRATAGFLRWPIRRAGGMAALRDPAAAERLGAAPGYPATIASLPAVRARRIDRTVELPGADELVRSLITLPTHSRVTPAERRALARLVDASSPNLAIHHG